MVSLFYGNSLGTGDFVLLVSYICVQTPVLPGLLGASHTFMLLKGNHRSEESIVTLLSLQNESATSQSARQ